MAVNTHCFIVLMIIVFVNRLVLFLLDLVSKIVSEVFNLNMAAKLIQNLHNLIILIFFCFFLRNQ